MITKAMRVGKDQHRLKDLRMFAVQLRPVFEAKSGKDVRPHDYPMAMTSLKSISVGKLRTCPASSQSFWIVSNISGPQRPCYVRR